MKGFGDENKSKKENFRNKNKGFNYDLLIEKAFLLQSQGKKIEAAKYYSYLIKNGLEDHLSLIHI